MAASTTVREGEAVVRMPMIVREEVVVRTSADRAGESTAVSASMAVSEKAAVRIPMHLGGGPSAVAASIAAREEKAVVRMLLDLARG